MTAAQGRTRRVSTQTPKTSEVDRVNDFSDVRDDLDAFSDVRDDLNDFSDFDDVCEDDVSNRADASRQSKTEAPEMQRAANGPRGENDRHTAGSEKSGSQT